MYIIIVGCGKVGYHVAQALLSAGHEVLAIEQDSQKYAAIVDALGSVVISGDGAEAAVLEEAGAGRADAVIAVTGQDDDNLMACQVAKLRFKVAKTIALVNNPENESLFRKLGVDVTVSQTSMILSHIEEELPEHPLVHLFPLPDSDRRLVGIPIPRDAAVVGKPLESVTLPPDTLIVLLIDARGEPRLPTEGELFNANDEVVAVTTPSAEAALLHILTRVDG
ncbi:MAG: TrkA family potassium uptake protein [Dehalococcoidia bacterium]|nr:TrkA family potassium uptake protein [Dehalococcoidia bacterium]